MSIELDEAKRTLLDMKDKIDDLGSALRITELKESVSELEERTSAPDFWNDAAESGKVLKEIKIKKDKIDRYEKLVSRYEDTDKRKSSKHTMGLVFVVIALGMILSDLVRLFMQ